MSRTLAVLVALAVGCTPLRPLDPTDDAGARDASRPDATSIDAALQRDVLSLEDARIESPDALAPDAPGADAWAPDARLTDGGEVARADAGRDAFSPDARATPDAPMTSTDLVAWYPFDGTRDATGNGHTLTNEGVGILGTVGTFEDGDRLYCASAPDLAEIVGVTMWVRPSSLGGMGIRSTLLEREGHVEIFQRLSGALRCTWGGGAAVASGSRTAPDGAWTHVACVLETGRVALYVGGVLDVNAPIGGTVPPAMGNLQIGQACCPGGDTFVGDLSDVRLWRRAPSAMEIAALAADPP